MAGAQVPPWHPDKPVKVPEASEALRLLIDDFVTRGAQAHDAEWQRRWRKVVKDNSQRFDAYLQRKDRRDERVDPLARLSAADIINWVRLLNLERGKDNGNYPRYLGEPRYIGLSFDQVKDASNFVRGFGYGNGADFPQERDVATWGKVFAAARLEVRAEIEAAERKRSIELSLLSKEGEDKSRGATPPISDIGKLVNPKQERLPLHALATRPASLLLPQHQVIPFTDIHGLRERLVRWATETHPLARGRTCLGCLVHAPAGSGKTRLLIEVAAELTRSHGWLAGFIPRDVRGPGRELSEQALERLVLGDNLTSGLMLVVDYAESRQADVGWIADLLVRRSETIAKPARLVLTSRGAGLWWRELLRRHQNLQDLCSLGGESYEEFEIREPIPQLARRAMFEAAITAFRRYRDAAGASSADLHDPTNDILHALETESDYNRPLAVQMAALLHVVGVDLKKGNLGIASLLHQILGLEYQHWEKALNLRPDTESNMREAIKNGVAQVTLVGGVDRSQAAEALIEYDPLFHKATDIDVPRARAALELMFPADDGGLVALEPDLIGEHHVAEVATDELIDACLDWAGKNSRPRRRLLAVLNGATREEHGAVAGRAEALLSRLIETRGVDLGADFVSVAIETPGRLLALCRSLKDQLDRFDELSLETLNGELPLRSVELMELSVAVALRLVELGRNWGSDGVVAGIWPAVREHIFAGRLRNLSERLSSFWGNDEALPAIGEAVEAYRYLVPLQPVAYLPGLGRSLDQLARVLSRLGHQHHEAALTASQEAVGIFRDLEQRRPGKFLADLAASLNTQGNAFLNNKRYKAAVTATQEAAEIFRRLAQTEPERFLPDLAGTLMNFGTALYSDLWRRQEMLTALREGANIFRQLAKGKPDTFLPRLAGSLEDLGWFLSWSGEDNEAVLISREAVANYRRLAETQPDAFLKHLAGSLNKLAMILADLGRDEEARVASEEAVKILRPLAQLRPAAVVRDLAAALVTFNEALCETKRYGDAAAAAHEGITAIAPFVAKDPQAFGDQARQLIIDYRTACRSARSEIDRALIDRVEHDLLPLSKSEDVGPATATLPPKTEDILNRSGPVHAELRQCEDALAEVQQRIDSYRRLQQRWPDAYLPSLAMDLNTAALFLFNLSRGNEALAASQEAVQIYQRLNQAQPAAFLADHAKSLCIFGHILWELRHREDALLATQDALAIYWNLAQEQPNAFLPGFAATLAHLGTIMFEARQDVWLETIRQAVNVQRILAETQSDRFLPILARNLEKIAKMLSKLGRHDEATAVNQEAAEIQTRIVQPFPTGILPDLVDMRALLTRWQRAHALTQPLLDFHRRNRHAVQGLTRKVLVGILVHVDASGQIPEITLIERLAIACGASDDEISEIVTMHAKISTILRQADKTGTLDQSVLKELPEEIASQLRDAWDRKAG
jgi:tetratricopeptide (TPR) repeat protein